MFSEAKGAADGGADSIQNALADQNNAVDGKAEEKEKGDGEDKKERSVLQAKLTRLAIQIGYGGGWLFEGENFSRDSLLNEDRQ